MTRSYSRAYLTAACCSGYFLIGLVVSLTGVTLGAFAGQLSVSPARAGSYFIFCLGSSTFAMMFVTGPLIDRFGQKPVLVGGSLLCALALVLSGLVHSLAAVCLLMLLLGAGNAGMNGGLNTLVNHLYPVNRGQALNLVNVFFGLGAVVLPFLAGWLLESVGLPYLLTVAAALCLVPALLFAAGAFPPDVSVERFRLREARRAVADPLVVLFALVLFFYVGLEISLGTWSRLSMVERWQPPGPLDQLFLAGYWGSLVVGRLIAGTAFRDIPEHRLVLLCACGALAGIAVFIISDSMYLSGCALWFTGLCFAPVFPSTLGSAGNNFSRYTGTIFSMMIASGILGSVVFTTSVGRMASIFPLSGALWLILAGAVFLLAAQGLLVQRLKNRHSATDPA